MKTDMADTVRRGAGWLVWLYLSRFGASLSFMMYAGALTAIIPAWGMTAGEAGLIQTAFNVCYALSLVFSSLLADRTGAKRVFVSAAWLSAAASAGCMFFARSQWSGLLWFSALGLAQGGTYGPSIMLVAQGVPAARRGAAVGWLLAAASFGYFASIALSNSLAATRGYEAAFLVCGIGPLLGMAAGMAAVKGRPNIHAAGAALWPPSFRFLRDRSSLLLTLGYMTHCWELLGMWAWMPAFLTVALAGSDVFPPAMQGFWIAAAIHFSGGIAAFSMGHASDRFGRKRVLVGMGLIGAICSASIGWTVGQPSIAILLIAMIYGFSAIGDSPVLSTAMAESVEAGSLGAALATRSILGFGAGGLAPVVFGLTQDAHGGAASWGWSFLILGIGGLLATCCAALLPDGAHRESGRSH